MDWSAGCGTAAVKRRAQVQVSDVSSGAGRLAVASLVSVGTTVGIGNFSRVPEGKPYPNGDWNRVLVRFDFHCVRFQLWPIGVDDYIKTVSSKVGRSRESSSRETVCSLACSFWHAPAFFGGLFAALKTNFSEDSLIWMANGSGLLLIVSRLPIPRCGLFGALVEPGWECFWSRGDLFAVFGLARFSEDLSSFRLCVHPCGRIGDRDAF